MCYIKISRAVWPVWSMLVHPPVSWRCLGGQRGFWGMLGARVHCLRAPLNVHDMIPPPLQHLSLLLHVVLAGQSRPASTPDLGPVGLGS